MTNDEFNRINGLGQYNPGVDVITRAKRAAQNKLTAAPKEDSSDDEIEAVQRRRLGQASSSSDDEEKKKKKHHHKKKLPKKVDWVEAGAVTPVKNQGQCGSCWAFSAIGALEGAHFLKTGELVSLSEQELIDCDVKDKGCYGGLMDIAFEFDESGRGVCSEEDYPYEAAKNDSCNKDCTPVDETLVKSFTDVEEGSIEALQHAIVQQPVSIAIQANQMSFQFYKKGVYDNDECGEEAVIDHGVLAVGGSFEQAYLRLELVEHMAKIALVARQLGGAVPIPEATVQKLSQKGRPPSQPSFGETPKPQTVPKATHPANGVDQLVADALKRFQTS